MKSDEYIVKLATDIHKGAWDKLVAGILQYKVLGFHRRSMNFQLENKWTLYIGPRNSGKSVILNTCFHINQIVRNKNLRILIVSKTRPQSQALLRLTRRHFESNDLLSYVGAHQGFEDGDLWSASELTVSGRTEFHSEATLTALGIGGNLVGRHFDIIIADDLVDERNCTGAKARELKNFFGKELIGMLNPGGRLHVIGTRFSDEDLYQYLIDSKKFSVMIQPVYFNSLTGEDIKTPEEIDEAKKDGVLESIWPDRLTVEELEDRRGLIKDGHFFSQFMGNMNYYDKTQSDGFLLDNFREFESDDEEFQRYKDEPNIGIVDLSTGKDGGDFFVSAVMKLPHEAPIFLLDMYRDKVSREQQLEMIVSQNNAYKVKEWVIEANGYQFVMVEELEKRGLNVHPIYTSRNKKDRFRTLRGHLDYRGVRYRKPHRHFMQEFVDYPDVKNDDVIDVFDFADTYSGFKPEMSSEYEELFWS